MSLSTVSRIFQSGAQKYVPASAQCLTRSHRLISSLNSHSNLSNVSKNFLRSTSPTCSTLHYVSKYCQSGAPEIEVLNEINEMNENTEITDGTDGEETERVRVLKYGIPRYEMDTSFNTRATSALYDGQYPSINKIDFSSERYDTGLRKDEKHAQNVLIDETVDANERKKALKKRRCRIKTEYEISRQIKARYDAKLSEKLEREKPVHHAVFTRIQYEPAFPRTFKYTSYKGLDATAQLVPKPWDQQRTGVIAQKVGMMTLYDKNGIHRPITICRLDAVRVVQMKTEQNPRRGTYSLQLGYGSSKLRRLNWSELGHFASQGVAPARKLSEFQVGKDALLPVGTEITCEHFLPGQFVDVQGVTKGKGFQGTMKRWGHKGGPGSHGATKFHRKRGSSGGCNDPGKNWKGMTMAGNMGNKNSTSINMRVFRIEPKQNLIYLVGHVAGCNGNFVRIRDAHYLPPKSPPFPTFFRNPNKPVREFMQWRPRKNKFVERDPDPDTWVDKATKDLK